MIQHKQTYSYWEQMSSDLKAVVRA